MCICLLVYAKCTRGERVELWRSLRDFRGNFPGPWATGGDYNTITSVRERWGGERPNVNAMMDFCNCIRDCDLIDIGFVGADYTWEARGMKQRLDRFMFNQEWLDLFKDNVVTHGIRRKSDHKPLVLESSLDSRKKRDFF